MNESSISSIRHTITSQFSLEELRTLCFDLEIDHEEIPGGTKSSFARELLNYARHRGLIPELVGMLKEIRPNIPLDGLPSLENKLIPYHRHPSFVDREGELEVLHKALQVDSPDRPHVVALCGMGGTGKTWLATEYCYRCRDDQPTDSTPSSDPEHTTKELQYSSSYPDGIFWLDAAKPLEDEYAALGMYLGYDDPEMDKSQAIYAASQYLKRHSNVLLVFDNTERLSKFNDIMEGPLVQKLPCRVLFISRRQRWGIYHAITVSGLPRQQALRLLLRGSERKSILAPTHPEHKYAQVICQMLGGLPLALEIAGAFLAKWPEVSLHGFQTRLQQKGLLAPLNKEAQEMASEPGTAIQERVSSSRLTKKAQKKIVTAILKTQWDQLTDNDARFVLRIAGQLPYAGPLALSWFNLLANKPDKEPGDIYWISRALDKLEGVSLVQQVDAEQVWFHPLVHEYAAQLEGSSTKLRSKLVTNVRKVLQDPRHQEERAIVAGQCLAALKWKGSSMKQIYRIVIDALRKLMSKDQVDETCRSDAAYLLTRLRWLDYARNVSSEEMLVFLELVSHTDSLDDRKYIVPKITKALKSDSMRLSRRQRVRLLIHRAGMRGYLHRYQKAKKDYAKAQKLNNDLVTSKDAAHEDLRVSTRINLGAGILASVQATELTKPDDKDFRQELLQNAVDSYLEAEKSAHAYQDPLLELIVSKEIGYAYVQLGKWKKSKQYCDKAREILAPIENPNIQKRFQVRILDVESNLYLEKGRTLVSEDKSKQALGEFKTAYECAQQEMSILQELGDESDDLAIAHVHVGQSLFEMSQCLEYPEPGHLAQARTHLQTALDMADSLGLRDLSQEVQEYLDQHFRDERSMETFRTRAKGEAG